MHRALQSPEVISSIASYAYWGRNDYDTPLDLRNVLALALTCRAFLEPALDQLWRRQLNIFNLIKTLPSDAWDTYEGDFRGPDGRRQLLIKNTRVIIPGDWPRFNYYSTRIKELGFDPRLPSEAPQVLRWRKHEVPMLTFTALCTVRFPPEILPSIRRIRWTSHEFRWETHLHIYIMLNNPLISLSFDFSDFTEETGGRFDPVPPPSPLPPPLAPLLPPGAPPPPPPPLPTPPALPDPNVRPPSFDDNIFLRHTLKAILEQCPNFKDFEAVTPPQFEKWYGKAIAEYLHTATGLRTFAINLRTWEISDLAHLAGLPTLRKTRVHLANPDCSWLACVPSGRPFPALVDLTLDVHALEYAAPFFIAWGCSGVRQLQRLIVNATRRPAPAIVPAFFATLAAHCSPSTLTVLALTDKGEATEATPDRASLPITADALFPLTALTALRSLTLDLSGVYVLDGVSLASLLPSWPEIEQLSLGAGHGWAAGPSAPLSFAGLEKIVAVAPKLESLHVAVNTVHDDLAGTGVTNTRMRTINLVDSYVADGSQDRGESAEACAVRISRNLARIFPDLERVEAKMRLSPFVPDSRPVCGAEAHAEGEQDEEEDEAMEGQEDGNGDEPARALMDTECTGLGTRAFWHTVEKQIATFALLRDVDVPMDLS